MWAIRASMRTYQIPCCHYSVSLPMHLLPDMQHRSDYAARGHTNKRCISCLTLLFLKSMLGQEAVYDTAYWVINYICPRATVLPCRHCVGLTFDSNNSFIKV